MRTITKQFEVYNFNELDKKIKEKVLEKEIQTQLDLYCETCLENDMNEEAKELVKNEFGENAKFKRCFYDFDLFKSKLGFANNKISLRQKRVGKSGR